MKTLTTSTGETVLVDDEDYDYLSQFEWHLDHKGYVIRRYREGGKPRHERMHREILGLGRGDRRQGDHRNGDKLDNRRSNLRVCRNPENNWNKPAQRNSSTGIKGVTFVARLGKWRARVQYLGKRVHLGLFQTAELAEEFAALARDLAHGEFSNHRRAGGH